MKYLNATNKIKALGAGLGFAITAFFAPSVAQATSSIYELVEEGTGDYSIEKYVKNADGTYSIVTYDVSFGTTTIVGTYDTATVGTSYYVWSNTTNSYLSTTDTTDYDFSATVNITGSGAALANKTINASGFAGESLVIANGSAVDGGAYAISDSLPYAGGLNAIFIANKANSSAVNATYGGALSFTDDGALVSLSGAFIGNYATNSGSANNASSSGGAIHIGSKASITTITADFLNNYAEQTGGLAANGGAINNAGVITTLNGDFIANYVSSSSGTASGGAINNSKTISSLTGDFLGNYATTTSGTAQGGAIHNAAAGSITFVATSTNMQFTGNYVVDSNGTKISNAINNLGALTFNTGEGYSIFVNDGISGTETAFSTNSTAKITISGAGSTVFNNEVAYQAITVLEGASLVLGSVTVDDVAYSADLSASSLDMYSGSTLSFVVSASSSNSLSLGSVTLGTISETTAGTALASATDSLGVTFSLDLSAIYGEFDLTINLNSASDASVLYSFLDTDLDVIFADSSYDVSDNGSYDYLVEDADGNVLADFDVAYTDGDSFITISGFSNVAVPEPSTYAMILGALALGFAYYRRRK